MKESSMIPLVIFILFMVGTIVYSFIEGKDLSALKFRKEQADNLANENLLKLKVKDYTEKNVDFAKRYKIETLCLQAGLSWTYADYLITCVATAIVLLLFLTIILANPFLGLVFFILGLFIPKQILTFIKNRRFNTLENQIGPFMNMVIKRYDNTRDFEKSLILTMEEFRGTQPMYGELQKTVAEINVGVLIGDAMDNLARRTGNQYLSRLSDYYKIAYKLGTEEVREKLLNQAYLQFEENRKMKDFLKKEISEPVRDAYIMVATIPAFAGFGILTMDGFLEFYIATTMGKVSLAVIISLVLGAIWWINAKVGAPLT